MQRCLIVDDSRAFLSSARALLESQGMTVTACALSGEEALTIAKRAKPDLALVDVELAGEDGFMLARSLIAQDPTLSRRYGLRIRARGHRRAGGWVRRVRIHLEDRARQASDRGAVERLAGFEKGEDGEDPTVIVTLARKVELRKDVPDVFLDRTLADPERLRDAAIGPSFGHQREHLAFARCQLGQPIGSVSCSEHLADELGVDDRSAFADALNGIKEVGRVRRRGS